MPVKNDRGYFYYGFPASGSEELQYPWLLGRDAKREENCANLCFKCRQLDFLFLFRQRTFPCPANAPYDGGPWWLGILLGTPEEIKNNGNCDFCRLISHYLERENALSDFEVQAPQSIRIFLW